MVGPFRKPKVPRPRRRRRPLVLPQAPGQRNRRPRLNSLNANNSQIVLQLPGTSGGNSPENRRREQNARRNRQRRARNRRSSLLTLVENQSAQPRIGLFEMNALLQRILQQGDDFVRQIMQCPFFSQLISDLRNRAFPNPASVMRLSPSLRHIILIPSRIDALSRPEQSLLRESQVANGNVQVQNAQEGVPNANENSCNENLRKNVQGANELSPDNIKNGSDQNQDIQDASNQSRNTEVNEGNECGNNQILDQDIQYAITTNPNQEINQSQNTERQNTKVNDASENDNGKSLNQDIQYASNSNPGQEVKADNENHNDQNLNRDIQYASSSNPDQEVNAGNVNSIYQNQYQETQEANKNGNDANPENNDDKNVP